MAKKRSPASSRKKQSTQSGPKKPARAPKKIAQAPKKSAQAPLRPATPRKKKAAPGQAPGRKKAAAPAKPAAKKGPTTRKPTSVSATKRTAKRPSPPITPPKPRHASVDSYIASLNDWRKEVVARLRAMIQKAAPKAAEKVKGSQPVYEHHGPFAWIKAHARHVNLGFWRGVELPDPRKLLAGSGEQVRHIKLKSLSDAGKKELQDLVRVAAELNELKGSPMRRAGKAKGKAEKPAS